MTTVAEPATAPLRSGESWQKLTMTEPYTPAPPTGVGTDDYRCFLLDPELDQDSYLTGTQVLPGNPNVVHHVILFRVPPSDVSIAKEVDASEEGPGWTCFGDTRVGGQQVDDAPWLGAWAPGSGEAVYGKGLGVPLAKGSQIIMQVHYNLLAGQEPDTSSTQLRLTSGDADLTPVTTVLIPAPVELPCRPGHTDNPLCDRAKALEDVKARFGQGPGATADYLHFLCGTPTVAGPTQSCTRTIEAEGDHPRGRRTHASAGAIDQDRSEPRNRQGAHGPRNPRCGTSTIRPPNRSSRCTCARATPSRSPASTPRISATTCPPLKDSRIGTSSGARAAPTRCASAYCKCLVRELPVRWGPDPSHRRKGPAHRG